MILVYCKMVMLHTHTHTLASCWKCKIAEQQLPVKGRWRERFGLKISYLKTAYYIIYIFRVFGNDFRLDELGMQIQFRPQLHKVKFLSFVLNFCAYPAPPLLWCSSFLCNVAEIESNVSEPLNNAMYWHASKLAGKLRSLLLLLH